MRNKQGRYSLPVHSPSMKLTLRGEGAYPLRSFTRVRQGESLAEPRSYNRQFNRSPQP